MRNGGGRDDRSGTKRSAYHAGLCVGLMLGGATPASAAATIHEGVSPPAAAWRAAMEAGDLAALARMHDEATIAFPPGRQKLAGATAIMADYTALFAKYQVRVTIDDAHWIAEGPLVVSWGLTTLVLHPKGGGADVVSHTRFTDAATRIDGGWRYVVDHASTPNAR